MQCCHSVLIRVHVPPCVKSLSALCCSQRGCAACCGWVYTHDMHPDMHVKLLTHGWATLLDGRCVLWLSEVGLHGMCPAVLLPIEVSLSISVHG